MNNNSVGKQLKADALGIVIGLKAKSNADISFIILQHKFNVLIITKHVFILT